jgi:hypothetical protein
MEKPKSQNAEQLVIHNYDLLAPANPWLQSEMAKRSIKIISPNGEHGGHLRDVLTRHDWKMLRALERMGAVSAEHSVTQSQIADAAHTGEHKSRSNQDSFKRLSNLMLTKAVKNSGTWLTERAVNFLKEFPPK